MAKLNIDIEATNVRVLDTIDDKLNDIDKSTVRTEISLRNLVIGYGAAAAAGAAFGTALRKIGENAITYNKGIEESTRRTKAQTLAWEGAKASMSNWIGLTDIIIANQDRQLLGAQRLEAFFTGKSLPYIQKMHELRLEDINLSKIMNDSLDDYIKKENDATKATEDAIEATNRKLDAEASAEARQAIMWYNEQLKIKAEQEREDAKATKLASDALADKMKNIKSISDQFNYREGWNPAQQQWQSTFEDSSTKPIEENTKALTKNTKETEKITKSPSFMDTGGSRTRYIDPFNERMGDVLGSTTSGSTFGTSVGLTSRVTHAGGGTGTLNQRATPQKAEYDYNQARIDKEQKALDDLLLTITKLEQELTTWEMALERANAELADSEDLLAKVHSGLQSFASELEDIANSLATDWAAAGREALFGGTERGLTYSEATANAQAAWDIYQTDTFNQEYLDTYNSRMNDLIGTLDDFNDWTKYTSSQEQEFAKIVAMRELEEFQSAQDQEAVEVDLQLAVLKAILETTANTDANTLEANTIVDNVRTAVQDVESATIDGAVDTVAEVARNVSETSGVAGAVDRVQDATNAVETATNRIEAINQEIEDKKNEYADLESTRWAQTGSKTSLVWTGNYTDEQFSKKIYENVTVPTFGTVAETGQSIGFKGGGYTGNGGVNDVAGVVHGQEYVLTANTTQALGLNDSNGGVFAEMASMMYEQLKTTKKIHNLEKQMYKLQREVA